MTSKSSHTTTDSPQSTNASKRPRPELSPLYNPQLLPDELKDIDFTKRITWGKYAPYTPESLPLKPLDAPASPHRQRLELHVHALSKRARACTIHLQRPSSRSIPTPMFMPVGTKGCLKGVTVDELNHCLNCPIILGNTYHLAIQPGTELIREQGQLRAFQGNGNYNLLTDSGGFQMVSLSRLSNITEAGVTFENPFCKGETMLLKPEDSIRHQTNIGADIIMALDDVVSSVLADNDRFVEATLCAGTIGASMQKQSEIPIIIKICFPLYKVDSIQDWGNYENSVLLDFGIATRMWLDSQLEDWRVGKPKKTFGKS